MDPSELVSLVAALNPENTAGRLAVIVRMGAKQVHCPALFPGAGRCIQSIEPYVHAAS